MAPHGGRLEPLIRGLELPGRPAPRPGYPRDPHHVGTLESAPMHGTSNQEFIRRMKNTQANPYTRTHPNPRDPYYHKFITPDRRITSIFKLWRDWLAVHTIDPDEVDARGWVKRDLTRCQVIYRSFIIDPHTNRFMLDQQTYPLEAVVITKTIQLESAPMVFPYIAIDRILHDLATLEHADAELMKMREEDNNDRHRRN